MNGKRAGVSMGGTGPVVRLRGVLVPRCRQRGTRVWRGFSFSDRKIFITD
jgi:hypothetical protein